MEPYHPLQAIEEPPSLRYTFVPPLESYAEVSRTNYLVAALQYQHSILVENTQAEPFPFCQDLYVSRELRKTSYFVEGNGYTNLRRIEDFVVLEYVPRLSAPPRKHPNYRTFVRLQKQFNYLHKQARDFKKNYFSRAWIETNCSDNFQELFKYDLDQPHTDSFKRIFHQIALETQRYLTLNKYHLIQLAHLETGISYSLLHDSFKAPDPDIDQEFISDYWIHPEETEYKRYIFDYWHRPSDREVSAPAWEFDQVAAKGWNQYPFVPFQRPRPRNWILTTCPIATRHQFSDCAGDPDAFRYGSSPRFQHCDLVGGF